jgi:hypothetical protein
MGTGERLTTREVGLLQAVLLQARAAMLTEVFPRCCNNARHDKGR